MYSFTRVVIGPKLARMLIAVSSVVRSTSTSEMPSTPTLYSIPKKPIQGTSWTNWKPATAGSNASDEHDREHERDDGDRERAPSDRRQAVARDEREHERADDRREDRERQDVELADVDHQRASQMNRSATATRPSAMPSA